MERKQKTCLHSLIQPLVFMGLLCSGSFNSVIYLMRDCSGQGLFKSRR